MSDKDHVFTNPDADVFGVRNLPEAVKGALFARYSRSPRPLRELYEAEFAGADGRTGYERADALYRRVLDEYGTTRSPSSAAPTSPSRGRPTC